MNAIFISFDDKHFHFAKSFLFSIKANYSNHPLILANYNGKSNSILTFLQAIDNLKIINLRESYSYEIGHMPSTIVFQRFNLWTDQFDDYDNILYLDVDIIILSSLDYLFNKDDFYIFSDHSPYAKIFRQQDSPEIVDMLKEDNISIPCTIDSMANSGVFLIPKKYRTPMYYQKLIAIAEKYHRYVAFSDQSIISLWCLSENIVFHAEYENNCQIRFFYYKDICIAIDDIRILHFSGGAKPGMKPNGILGDDGVTDFGFYFIANDIRYFYRKARENDGACRELISALSEKYVKYGQP